MCYNSDKKVNHGEDYIGFDRAEEFITIDWMEPIPVGRMMNSPMDEMESPWNPAVESWYRELSTDYTL